MKKWCCLVVLAVVGCGNSVPPQSTDPAALERERTKGRELREDLEGVKAPKK